MAVFEVGDIGWAKMKGYSPWPALIIEPNDIVKPPKVKEPVHWVRFFGTNDNSWVVESNILPFEEGRKRYENKGSGGNFKKAVQEIISYAGKHPESIRNIEVPQTNGVLPSENSLQSYSFETPKTKASPKVSSVKRASKSMDSVKKKKRRSSEESSNFSIDSNSSQNTQGEKYSILLNDPTDDTLYSRNYKTNNYNWDISLPCALVAPTLGLINRPVPDTPMAPVLDIYEKSEKMLNSSVEATPLKIGFLGMGYMGRSMVKNLLQTNHVVTIWNRTPDKCKEFEKIGAIVEKTPADVIQASDITFSCLSDPQAAKHIVFCNCGVLTAITPGKGYIDMTSIDPDTSRSIYEAISHKSGRYLEVPALGTRSHAKDGTLILLAAGDKSLFDEARSCFQAISSNIFFLGEVGKASKMNLVINMVMGACFATVSEAMSLAEKSDINLKQVVEVLEKRDLNCPAIIQQAKAIVANSINVAQMPLQHMQRNLHLALEIGDQYAQPLPTTAAANEVFKHVKRMGYGSHDVSALFMRARCNAS